MSQAVIYYGRLGMPTTLAQWKRRELRFAAAMGDIVATIERHVAEGDTVTTQWRLEATHRGPLVGHAATGKRILIKSMCFDRVMDDLVVEHWGVRDLLSVLRQIGAAPTFEPDPRP